VIVNEHYWQRVRARAKALGSDGCTAVEPWNLDCCLLHDVMCRTGMDMDGNSITREEADYLFWECNRQRTPFSWLSPRSWTRWAGVRLGAWWNGKD
jgi:hypothetical protein